MSQQSRARAFRAYALPRPGRECSWDGMYDLLDGRGRPLRVFARVPSRTGFADPDLAILAAEIFADSHIRERQAA